MEITPNPKEVGERIRKIRKQLGFSMSEFASRIDTIAKSGTVSNWETGKNLPNNERLKKIAELGNTTIEYLLSGNPWDNLSPEEQELYIDLQIRSYQIEEFQQNEYPQLEDFVELGIPLYVNKYKLNDDEKKQLYKIALAMFGDREPNYPSDEEIEKAYEKYLKDIE